MKVKNNKLFKYLLITFTVTYIFWGGLAVMVQAGVFSFSHPLATVMHLIGGFGPTIAALLVLDKRFSVDEILKAAFRHSRQNIMFLFSIFLLEILVIAISSMEINNSISLYLVPIIFIQAVFIYGGNEELGWRGVMQPLLEDKFSFPVATLITGVVWGIWHIPLWFVDGASQQNIPFVLFLLMGIYLSFLFAAVYKKTKSVFYCSILHGLTNTLLSLFVIKVNVLLLGGLFLILVYCIFVWYLTKNS